MCLVTIILIFASLMALSLEIPVVNDEIVYPVSSNEVDIMCTGRHKLGVTPYILSYQCRQNYLILAARVARQYKTQLVII